MPSWMLICSARPEIVRMNECVTCAAHPYDSCRREDGRTRKLHHPARLALSLSLFGLVGARQYMDARTTSYGSSVCSPECEHCDGEKSAWTRKDDLRGWTCPLCDLALDEMVDGGSS